MDITHLAGQAAGHLHRLCVEIDNRRTGSPGNRAATDYAAGILADCGFAVSRQEFECTDWATEGSRLVAGGEPFAVAASPYSLGCDVTALLAIARTVDELAATDARGRVLLLSGELAREQLMPRGYPFYNPEEHQRIHALLDRAAPAAIVAATSRNPELAGALYPYPLIEDGGTDIPSVFMTEEEGRRLAQHAGEPAVLISRARRIPSTACNVIGRAGSPQGRVVLAAHIDAKLGSPGALENAAGVAVLLLLAELLAGHDRAPGIEIVAINGEDHYSAGGELAYLAANRGRLDEVALAVNFDAAGYRQGATATSLYECPEPLADAIRGAFAGHADLIEGQPWFQSDHMVFVQNGVSAVAFTSERFAEIETRYAHTPADRPELVDPARLATAAVAVRDLVRALAAS